MVVKGKGRGKKLIETKTLIYILIVLLIAGGVYLLISSTEDTEKVYDIEDIYAKNDGLGFINKTITIKGYYNSYYEVITSPNNYDDATRNQILKVDMDENNINTSNIVYTTPYEFTGEIKKDTTTVQDPNDIILIVEKFEEK